jgi:hypothetical protein
MKNRVLESNSARRRKKPKKKVLGRPAIETAMMDTSSLEKAVLRLGKLPGRPMFERR